MQKAEPRWKGELGIGPKYGLMNNQGDHDSHERRDDGHQSWFVSILANRVLTSAPLNAPATIIARMVAETTPER